MITIKVIRSSSGKPAKGECVAIGFSALGRGVTGSEYTNEAAKPISTTIQAKARFTSTARLSTKVTAEAASWFTSSGLKSQEGIGILTCFFAHRLPNRPARMPGVVLFPRDVFAGLQFDAQRRQDINFCQDAGARFEIQRTAFAFHSSI